jgi:hypothetical protein
MLLNIKESKGLDAILIIRSEDGGKGKRESFDFWLYMAINAPFPRM